MIPLDFARRHLGQFKINGDEIVPMYCPFCRGGNSHDKYTFAMNKTEGTYNCKRGSCGESGSFERLLKHFGEWVDKPKNYEIQRIKKVYKPPQTQVKAIAPEAAEYLKKRGFSQSTWERRKVGDDGKGNIAMPYYENGKLVMMKFRPAHKPKDGEKKGWREEGGKPVFWGIDLCAPDKSLIIVEGEMDALALDEAGIPNVVSVPSGAEDLTCVDLCWDWLQRFKKVIIWTDSDEPGQKCRENLIKRLGAGRCAVINHSRKDANEVLLFDGKQAVIDAFKSAVDVPINGLVRLADVKSFDVAESIRANSSIRGLNKVLGGYRMGELTVWTGINSSGKSTMLGQELINAVDQGFGVCAYSGELPGPIYRYWVDLQAAGPENLAERYDRVKEANTTYVQPAIAEKIREWYRDKFFLYDAQGVATEDGLIEIFTYAIQRYNCQVFLVDNLMTVLLNGGDSDFYRNQSKFVGRMKDFTRQYKVHVHLVAHPRKTQGRITKMDVAGTGDITNLADNVLAVHRLNPKEKDEWKEGIPPDAIIDIFKNRFEGQQDVEILLGFSERCKRFCMLSEPQTIEKQYGWNKKPEQIGIEVSTENIPKGW